MFTEYTPHYMVTPPEEHTTVHTEAKEFVLDTRTAVQSSLHNFITFIREQGVIGLAIGFLLSGSVSKTVSSLVDNVINPLIGLGLGKVNLADKMIVIGASTIKYGAFVSSIVDFIIIAAVIYFIFKGLGLDRLDKKKA